MKRRFLVEYASEDVEGSNESTGLVHALECAIEHLDAGCEVSITEFTGGKCRTILETCSIAIEGEGEG